MIARGIVAALVVMPVVVACNNGPMRPQGEQAMAAATESSGAAGQAERRAKPGADSRSQVQLHPEKYLEASSPQSVTRGLLNETSQLTAVTVLNTSRFALTGLQGMVTWVDASGNVLPVSTQLVLDGSIAAGASATFALGKGITMSGAIIGKGTPKEIMFTTAMVQPP
jgi:hypothetical protein